MQTTLAFRSTKANASSNPLKRKHVEESCKDEISLQKVFDGIEDALVFHPANTTVTLTALLGNVSRLVNRTCQIEQIRQIMTVYPGAYQLVARTTGFALVVPLRDEPRKQVFAKKLRGYMAENGANIPPAKLPSMERSACGKLHDLAPNVTPLKRSTARCEGSTAARSMSLVERIREKQARREAKPHVTEDQMRRNKAKGRMLQVADIIWALLGLRSLASFGLNELTEKITDSMKRALSQEEAQDVVYLLAEAVPSWCRIVPAGQVIGIRFFKQQDRSSVLAGIQAWKRALEPHDADSSQVPGTHGEMEGFDMVRRRKEL